jgi:hypothetical protein
LAAAALVRHAVLPGRRALVHVTRGRLGLWRPKPGGWGALRLNLEAARRARLQVDGQGYRVANPRIVPLAEIETQLPAIYRRTSARRMIPEWLVLTAGPDAAAASTTSASSVLGVTGGQASGCTESPRRRSDAVAPSKRIG